MTSTQADREAAMMIRRITAARLQEAGFTVSGITDPEDDLLIQAFARHRLAAEAAAFEKAAGVADTIAANWRTKVSDYRQRGNYGPYLGIPTVNTVAPAIRKLAGEKHD